MKELNLTKESYERSSLIITEFSEEDVIVTSGENFFQQFFGDNDTIMMPNR